MKNKDELEKIACGIFAGIIEDCRESLQNEVDDIECSKDWRSEITEALQRVQDEALNSVLPSEEECLEYIQPRTIGNEGVRTGMVTMHRWLRANLRTAPKPLESLSNEEE